MSDAVNCEYCVNYSYDDDYECYTCEINRILCKLQL